MSNVYACINMYVCMYTMAINRLAIVRAWKMYVLYLAVRPAERVVDVWHGILFRARVRGEQHLGIRRSEEATTS